MSNTPYTMPLHSFKMPLKLHSNPLATTHNTLIAQLQHSKNIQQPNYVAVKNTQSTLVLATIHNILNVLQPHKTLQQLHSNPLVINHNTLIEELQHSIFRTPQQPPSNILATTLHCFKKHSKHFSNHIAKSHPPTTPQ